MRRPAYIAVLVVSLAVLLAFATAPAVAQMTPGSMMEELEIAIQEKGRMGGWAEVEFVGEAKAGIKGESKGPVRAQPEAGIMETTPRADISARAQGGTAVVVGVDMPENCLRVRSEPSAGSDIITCVPQGQTVNLVGVFSEDKRWAQLDNNGWALFSRLRTDVRPSGAEWEKAAAEGKKSKGKKAYRGHKFRHYYGCFYPGYYYYGYPGYYRYGYRNQSFGFPRFFGRHGGLWY